LSPGDYLLESGGQVTGKALDLGEMNREALERGR